MTEKQNSRRRDDVQTEDLPDGSTLLFDSVSLMTYPISSSASLVWRACDGLHGIDEIVDQMESHYEVDRETAEKDVSKLLHDFAELGLPQGAPKAARTENPPARAEI